MLRIKSNHKILFRLGIVVFSLTIFSSVFVKGQGFDLDEFDDLELESLDNFKKGVKKNTDTNQKVILFDDNLYLLDDDFDFGKDELELQKLELDPDDMETGKEYADFLNAFFENSIPVGENTYSKASPNRSTPPKDRKSKMKTQKKSREKKSSEPKRSTQTSSNFRPKGGSLGFGVSTIIGATIPITMVGFSTGSNFGIRIDTPISFNLAGMEANVGTDIYFSSMTSSDGGNNLTLTNIIGNFSLFPLSSIEIRTGLGITPLSKGNNSVTALSIPVDVNYYLPMNVSGFKFALNLHAQRALGYPAGEEGDSTDFLYMGLLINTPLVF